MGEPAAGRVKSPAVYAPVGPALLSSTIFDAFFTTKEVGRGSGQGLAIARSVIIDEHGGRLTFDTAVGAGPAASDPPTRALAPAA